MDIKVKHHYNGSIMNKWILFDEKYFDLTEESDNIISKLLIDYNQQYKETIKLVVQILKDKKMKASYYKKEQEQQ